MLLFVGGLVAGGAAILCVYHFRVIPAFRTKYDFMAGRIAGYEMREKARGR